ncbi:hypothetical protein COOONC_03712 [Cooperia oncophora]
MIILPRYFECGLESAKGAEKAPHEAIVDKLLDCDDLALYVIGQPENSSRFVPLTNKLKDQRAVEPRQLDVVDFKSTTRWWLEQPNRSVYSHQIEFMVSMPIYHTAAGILGVGQAICRDSSCVIRKRFSASNFWKDCVKYHCTVSAQRNKVNMVLTVLTVVLHFQASQYIGELCRYLLASQLFPKRLHIKCVSLWERSSCGNMATICGPIPSENWRMNIDGYVGACGFLPIYPFTKMFYPVRLIRVDDKTGEVVRSESGLCVLVIQCKAVFRTLIISSDYILVKKALSSAFSCLWWVFAALHVMLFGQHDG